MKDVPDALKIGDTVKVCIRQHYVHYRVFAVDGDTVLACWPQRGAVRFTWSAGMKVGLDSRGRRYYFTSRAEVTPGSVWRHKNGGVYRVLFVTNTDNPREDHPPDVVYEALRNPAHKWSRRLSDWRRSFNPDQEDET